MSTQFPLIDFRNILCLYLVEFRLAASVYLKTPIVGISEDSLFSEADAECEQITQGDGSAQTIGKIRAAINMYTFFHRSANPSQLSDSICTGCGTRRYRLLVGRPNCAEMGRPIVHTGNGKQTMGIVRSMTRPGLGFSLGHGDSSSCGKLATFARITTAVCSSVLIGFVAPLFRRLMGTGAQRVVQVQTELIT